MAVGDLFQSSRYLTGKQLGPNFGVACGTSMVGYPGRRRYAIWGAVFKCPVEDTLQ